MEIACLLIGIISAWILFVQDVRRREISLFVLILFGLAGAGYRYAIAGTAFLCDTFLNSLMVLCILGVVLAYYGLRGKKRIMDHLLGWGDIAMLLALAPWFTPWHFSLFYCFSTAVLSILFLLMIQLGYWKPMSTIPLAGLMGLFFSLFFSLYLFLS